MTHLTLISKDSQKLFVLNVPIGGISFPYPGGYPGGSSKYLLSLFNYEIALKIYYKIENNDCFIAGNGGGSSGGGGGNSGGGTGAATTSGSGGSSGSNTGKFS